MKKIIIIGVILLFIMCTVGTIAVDCRDGILTNGHLAYGLDYGLYVFELPELINFNYICPDISNLSGCAWTHHYKHIFVCDAEYGNISEIDPETCETRFIGSSGTSELINLAYDLYHDTLWGISTDNLYSINMTTGNATCIGPMSNTSLMVSMAADRYGNVWTIDLGFSSSNFYCINTNSGHATLIGNTGVSMNYADDMAYDKDNDILYLFSFNYGTYQQELYTINTTTGIATFVKSSYMVSLFTIPYNISNIPPDAPTITGPMLVRPGRYDWKFRAIDPDGDNVSYEIDWGDGTSDKWIGPFASGDEIAVRHTYEDVGTVKIRARAKDEHDAIGNWSDLDIEIPKIRQKQRPFWYMLFERLPNIFPIIRQILAI
jgi:hypothetical protein